MKQRYMCLTFASALTIATVASWEASGFTGVVLGSAATLLSVIFIEHRWDKAKSRPTPPTDPFGGMPKLFDDPAPRELNAELRTASASVKDMIQAYMEAGLTREEALDLTKAGILKRIKGPDQ